MKSVRFLLLVGAAASLLALVGLAPAALAEAPGDLDDTFGVQGVAMTGFGDGFDVACAMDIQPDGKYVLAGIHSVWSGGVLPDRYVSLVRFNADGSLDTTFGTDGKVTANLEAAYHASTGRSLAFRGVADVLVLPSDGRIFVAGGWLKGANDYLSENAIACFTASGALDTTWGTDGFAPVSDAPWTTYMSEEGWNRFLVAGPDGKVLYGCTLVTNLSNDFAVSRLNADGTLDTTFGANGRRLVDISGGSKDDLFFMTTDAQGRILLGGSCQSLDAALVRLTSGGALDTTFGTGGKVVTPRTPSYNASLTDLCIAPSGDLIALGCAGSGWRGTYVRRYTSAGVVDKSFGKNGDVELRVARTVNAQHIACQASGGIVLGGVKDSGAPTYNDIWLGRLAADGAMDPYFGGSGEVVTDLGGADDCAAMQMDANGKIVAAGYALVSSGSAIAGRSALAGTVGLARYLTAWDDAARPETVASAAAVKAGQVVKLKFRVNDAKPTCGKAIVRIQIKKRSKVVQTVKVGARATNASLSYSYRARLAAGSYTWRVLATDIAGHVATRMSAAKLTVK